MEPDAVSSGFYKRRRGILEHLEAGTIGLIDLAVHDYLCLKINAIRGSDCSIPAGVCFSSSVAISAISSKEVSERTIRRSLEHLEKIGWIKRWTVPGKHGNYPVLVARASVHDLSGNEYRVNAEATTDWRFPAYVTGEEAARSWSPDVRELSTDREERVEKAEKKHPAAKPAPPADPRHKSFFEFAYETFRMKFLQPPSWGAPHAKGLQAFLRRSPQVTLAEWQRRYEFFLASTERFYQQQKGSLIFFAAKFDHFIDGPILEKGGAGGNVTSFSERRSQKAAAAINTVLGRFEKASGDIRRALPPANE